MPMAAASPEKLHCGEVGSGDEEKEEAERADAEVIAQQLSDQSLREKAQRLQGLLTEGTSERLPDRGRKLRATLDAIHREQDRRQAQGDGARAPGNEACERRVRSRCIESSCLRSDLSRVKVSVADFMSSFGADKEAGINISSLEIESRSPNKPSTLIGNKGKLCEEKNSCEASSQPMNSVHEELHLDTSENMGKTSSGDASNSNVHNILWEEVPTPSRKRKGADPVNFSMRLRSRKASSSKSAKKWSLGQEYGPLDSAEKRRKQLPQVPQQENDYDCGLFVLYYMQQFIQEAPERFQKKDYSMFGKRWFRPEEPSQLRDQIRHLLHLCRETELKKKGVTESCGEGQPKIENDGTDPNASEPTTPKHLSE